MSLKELIDRAMTLQTSREVKELVRDSHRMDHEYKVRVYSAIAWLTGLTIHEVWAMDSDLRLKNRHPEIYEHLKK